MRRCSASDGLLSFARRPGRSAGEQSVCRPDHCLWPRSFPASVEDIWISVLGRPSVSCSPDRAVNLGAPRAIARAAKRGRRSHLLRYQWVTKIRYSIRCISGPRVRLKRCIEIIHAVISALARLLVDSLACTECPWLIPMSPRRAMSYLRSRTGEEFVRRIRWSKQLSSINPWIRTILRSHRQT